MSKFTKMWRVTHDEPLTYNERIINSACDIIERQDEQIKALRKTKCPPISVGDSCICLIEELEALMQRAYDCVPKGSGLQKEIEQALKPHI